MRINSNNIFYYSGLNNKHQTNVPPPSTSEDEKNIRNYVTGCKIQGLDFFRALSAFGIMIYHWFFIGPLQGFYAPHMLMPIGFIGKFGVDSFFILSGFFILQSFNNKSCSEFIIDRIKRIYPPYIIASIITVILGYYMPNTNIYDLIMRWTYSVSFIGDLLNVPFLSNIYWTLFIEVRFYLVTCIIMYISRSFKYDVYTLFLLWLLISFINVFSGYKFDLLD